MAAEMTPEKAIKFRADCEAQRAYRITRIEDDIALIKRGRADRDMRAQLPNLKADLADLKAFRKRALPVLSIPFKSGEIGLFSGSTNGRIFQILGPDEMICEVEIGREKQLLIIRGISTMDRTDDSPYSIGGVFEVLGNRTYPTALGSRTVMAIEAFDVEAADELAPPPKPANKPKPTKKK